MKSLSPARMFCAAAATAMLLAAQDQPKTPNPAAGQAQQERTANPSQTTNPAQTSSKTDNTGTRSRIGETDAMVNTSETRFLNEAAIAGMAEVQMAQLAQQKGSSDAIKQYGSKLEKDHTASNEELKKLAASKNVNLPTEVDQKHKASFDKLNKLEGAAFDRAFAKQAVSDHKRAIGLFERAERNSYDSDVKAFAAKHLSGLREHLSTAQNLASQKTSAASAPKQ